MNREDDIESLHELWAKELAENGGRRFVENAPVADGFVLYDNIPIRVDHSAFGATYVCSVYTTIVDYAVEELDIVSSISPAKKIHFRTLVFFISKLLRVVKIDEVVSVNNFLLSTNFYPTYRPGLATKIITELSEKYPKHAIMFRSVNRRCNAELICELKNTGCFLIPSRQVFIIDPKNTDLRRCRSHQNDLKLFRKTPYKVAEHHDLLDADFRRIVQLYDLLYLEKYSQFNPAFTEEFIRFAHDTGLIRFVGLRNESGILDGIKGCYYRGNVMTSSIIGYDTALPQKLGLYRMLTALSIQEAEKSGMLFNMSSGVGPFKLSRCAVKEIEFSAVYTKHLKLSLKKVVWSMLVRLLNMLVLPMMEKYDF